MKPTYKTLTLLIALLLIVACGGGSDGNSDLNLTSPNFIEITYDDGASERSSSPWSEETGSEIAVRFSSDDYPFSIQSVRFFITSSGVPSTPFRIRVYDKDSNGQPNNLLCQTGNEAASVSGNEWVEVDISSENIVINSGDFFISMYWETAPGLNGLNAQFLGSDMDLPSSQRTFFKFGASGDWVYWGNRNPDADYMIRATISYQSTSGCTDTDGDGYFQESGCGTFVDCNDHASNIYPGAPELCDGIDNQCSGDTGYGEIDEGCTIDINSYAGTYTGTITIDSASPEASADESLLGSYRCTVVIGNPTYVIDEQYLCSISATRVIGGGTPSTSYGTLYEDGTFVGTVSINPILIVGGTIYGNDMMSLDYQEQYNGAMYSVYAATLTKQ